MGHKPCSAITSFHSATSADCFAAGMFLFLWKLFSLLFMKVAMASLGQGLQLSHRYRTETCEQRPTCLGTPGNSTLLVSTTREQCAVCVFQCQTLLYHVCGLHQSIRPELKMQGFITTHFFMGLTELGPYSPPQCSVVPRSPSLKIPASSTEYPSARWRACIHFSVQMPHTGGKVAFACLPLTDLF